MRLLHGVLQKHLQIIHNNNLKNEIFNAKFFFMTYEITANLIELMRIL